MKIRAGKFVLWSAGALLCGALTGPRCARFAYAVQSPTPHDQASLNALAATLPDATTRDRVLSRAGHAFDNGEARLFWFTDLNAARAQAKREGKPILSLRLLGNLSDEYSCANSRLFRVLLYPNAEINKLLREKFVLHWSSERPVPVVTIDMGDGRVIRRTLTGNSAHYLLSSDGEPLDVLPGLYAPDAFEAWLQNGLKLENDWRAAPVETRPAFLQEWHRARLTENIAANSAPGAAPEALDLAVKLNIERNFLRNGAAPRLDARTASTLTTSKMVMEMPVLNVLSGSAGTLLSLGESRLSVGKTGLFSNGDVKFDAATRARIAAMQPLAVADSVDVTPPSERLIETLETNVALDTRNNRRSFEPAIHAYFVNEAAPDFAILNRAIYDKLFRTPASDAWLGLVPGTVFTALRGGGVTQLGQQQKVAQRP